MNPDPAVEYAWELCSAYWPGLPREDFDAYMAVGVDAAVLLEAEWEDVIAGGPLRNWQDMNAASELDRERIRAFYDQGFGLIFELLRGIAAPGTMGAADHRANIVQQYMAHLQGHGPILDYGGGIGQQSIFLARLGWQVAFTDLGETAAFARWRFQREGLLGTWGPGVILPIAVPDTALEETEPSGIEPWGALCALDVVEHVPDPVGLLHQFAGCLAPDGALFLTRHSFKPYPAHLPEAAQLQQTLDEVLAGMGFEAVIPPDGHFGIGGWQRARVT